MSYADAGEEKPFLGPDELIQRIAHVSGPNPLSNEGQTADHQSCKGWKGGTGPSSIILANAFKVHVSYKNLILG